MAGVQDLEAKKAARWAKAEKYAQGYADHGMGHALTVYYTRYFPLITLTALSLAVIIAFLRAAGGPVDWLFAAWIGTFLLGLSAAIGGITYNLKRLKQRGWRR